MRHGREARMSIVARSASVLFCDSDGNFAVRMNAITKVRRSGRARIYFAKTLFVAEFFLSLSLSRSFCEFARWRRRRSLRMPLPPSDSEKDKKILLTCMFIFKIDIFIFLFRINTLVRLDTQIRRIKDVENETRSLLLDILRRVLARTRWADVPIQTCRTPRMNGKALRLTETNHVVIDLIPHFPARAPLTVMNARSPVTLTAVSRIRERDAFAPVSSCRRAANRVDAKFDGRAHRRRCRSSISTRSPSLKATIDTLANARVHSLK